MALFGAAAALLLFAGCSGGGQNNPLPDPGSNISAQVPDAGASTTTTENPTTTMSTTATVSPSQSYLLVKGPIDAVSTNEFHMNGGTGIGNIWIHTTSSTHKAYGGLTPKVGEYAVVTGTGSYATSITAVYAALYTSTAPTTTLSGQLSSTQPYGFAMRLNNGTYAALALDRSSQVSGSTALWKPVSSVAIGNGSTGYVAVSLTGSGGTASTTTTTSTPAPAAPVRTSATAPPSIASTTTTASSSGTRHVLTAEYLLGYYGTHSITPSQAAPYLSWAQTSIGDSRTIHNAGIKTQIYIDPNWIGSTDPMNSGSTEAIFSHTCGGSRVGVVFGSASTRYDTNPGSSAMRAHWASWVAAQKAAGWVDMVFEDNGGPLSSYAKYPNGMPCGYSTSTWISYAEGLNNSVGSPIIMNGLNAFTSAPAPNLSVVEHSSNTMGGNMEGCYNDLGDPIDTGTSWLIEENSEIALARAGKYFQCMGRDQASAASSTAARIFSYASFLLGYNPNTSVFESEWYTPSKFHVFPETGLVATSPVVSEPSSIASLRTSTGVYGREYNACYYRGTYIGKCAVAVNHTYGSVERFPFSGYTHTLTLSGYGVLDGGRASTSGPPPPSSMSAYTAVIAIR